MLLELSVVEQLLPYLRAGLDVDGRDISADMLALCWEEAARKGLSPTLYEPGPAAGGRPRRARRPGTRPVAGNVPCPRGVSAKAKPGEILARKDLLLTS